MNDQKSFDARRRFLKLALAGVTMPLSAGLAQRALAQEQLAEDDEMALQLGYKHDASEVNTEEWGEYVEGNICGNCQLFQAEAGAEWGGCEIFGGKQVNANGWCLSWIEREA